MSNDPNADLIYAILAMDSYSRGYGAGIKGLSDAVGTRIGDFVVSLNADDPDGEAKAAGFYAIAYRNTGTGDVVISYRGTDVPVPFSDEISGGSDLTHGYGLALGYTPDVEATIGVEQVRLALQFYQSVAQEAAGTITVTGHSLGGGLAGYVSSFNDTAGILFDNMPFGVAVRNQYAQLGLSQSLADAQIGQNRGYYTLGEFLAPVRAGDIQEIVGDIPLAGLLIESALGVNGAQLGADTEATEKLVNKDALASHAEGLSPFNDYHSMALLVALLWAKAENKTEWSPAGQQLWSAYIDEAVAGSFLPAFEDKIGTKGEVALLDRAISYSAIPEGDDASKPFGDTAIWSMFDDAGDLASVLAGNESGFFDDEVTTHEKSGLIFNSNVDIDVKQHLANLLVQYAGALALYDVEQAADAKTTVEGGSVDVREGILSRTEADSALAVDMSRQLWSDALGGNAVAPIDRDTFRQAYFKQAEDPSFWASFKRLLGLGGESGFSDADLQKLAKDIWGSANLDIFDRFHIAPTDTATTVMLDARGYLSNNGLGDKAQVDVYIGTPVATIANDNAGAGRIAA